MKNQLLGCVRINAQGKNIYRFINMIHSGRICCFGQYCKKDIFYGEIYRHDLPKVEQMAEECNVELKSAEYRTLSMILLKYRKRIGLLIGIVIAVSLALYFSNVVVTIDIQGNSCVSDEDIIAALNELDIKPGASIRDIDFHYCENRLRLMVEDISWAGIRHTGNRIVVEITEIVPRPEMTRDRVPCNLVAGKSAQITAVTVQDGFLMHKVGDYVPEGTLLVSGVSENANGHAILHHSMGVITGIYDETITFTEEFDPVRYIPTGKTADKKYLHLFSVNIPLPGGWNKFTSFSTDISESRLRIFGKELPLGTVKKHLTETELTETVYSREELEDRIMEKIYLYEKNFLSDVRIISRDINFTENEEALTAAVTYKLEGDIGVQKDIFVKQEEEKIQQKETK